MSTRVPRIALALMAIALVAGAPSLSAAASHAPALTDALRALDLAPLLGTPPPFALVTLDGGVRRLADLEGRPALLYFWATW
ncbi:MAG TPA: hypothetical protein VGU22_03280 [Methylomirabilota bacterium]|nr:hypothetical protein [Methylomirabilota bacterium]